MVGLPYLQCIKFSFLEGGGVTPCAGPAVKVGGTAVCPVVSAVVSLSVFSPFCLVCAPVPVTLV